MRQSAVWSQMWSSFPRTCDGTRARRWPEGLGRESPQGKPIWVPGEELLSPRQGWVLGWLWGSGWHRAAAGQRESCTPTGGGENPDLFPSVPCGLLCGMPQRWQPRARFSAHLIPFPGCAPPSPRKHTWGRRLPGHELQAWGGTMGKPAGGERGVLALPPPPQGWHRWLRKGSAHEQRHKRPPHSPHPRVGGGSCAWHLQPPSTGAASIDPFLAWAQPSQGWLLFPSFPSRAGDLPDSRSAELAVCSPASAGSAAAEP